MAFPRSKDATKALWKRLPKKDIIGNNVARSVTQHIVPTIAYRVKSFARFAHAATEGTFIAMTVHQRCGYAAREMPTSDTDQQTTAKAFVVSKVEGDTSAV